MHKRRKTLEPLEVRLARHTAPGENGCVNWTGTKYQGYGKMQLVFADGSRRRSQAHRVAYELAKGPIPAGLQLDHLCRNPSCCNPDHLEAVTPRENNRRSRSPSALNARLASCKRGHPFSEQNTKVYANGYRNCVQCEMERVQIRNAERRAATAARGATRRPTKKPSELTGWILARALRSWAAKEAAALAPIN